MFGHDCFVRARHSHMAGAIMGGGNQKVTESVHFQSECGAGLCVTGGSNTVEDY